MVQQHHAVGYHVRVVIWQADHAGAQPNVSGALGRSSDENFRRADGLPASAVVLANPRLIIPQRVQPLQ